MPERRLVLIKGEHQYVFHVGAGQEEQFLAAVARMADDERLNFDWQDVAFFCGLIGKDVPTAAN